MINRRYLGPFTLYNLSLLDANLSIELPVKWNTSVTIRAFFIIKVITDNCSLLLDCSECLDEE